MKISKQRLKQIINEELAKIAETKDEHADAISDKITRLRDAAENARRGIENLESGVVDRDELIDIRMSNAYHAKQTEIYNLEAKIELLITQLQQLRQEVPGRLTRPDEM